MSESLVRAPRTSRFDYLSADGRYGVSYGEIDGPRGGRIKVWSTWARRTRRESVGSGQFDVYDEWVELASDCATLDQVRRWITQDRRAPLVR